MSRTVIRDIVIPVVQKIMAQEGIGNSRFTVIQDPTLEEFLEEMMRMYFGVIGANDCQNLREQLEEAIKNDPYAFEFLIKRLLEKYVKLSIKLRFARKDAVDPGPPDRFSEQRKKYRLLFSPQEEQGNY